MSAVEVEFLGGPADGRIQAVCTEPDGNPPPLLCIHQHLTLGEHSTWTYRRCASQRDHGALWVYTPEGAP